MNRFFLLVSLAMGLVHVQAQNFQVFVQLNGTQGEIIDLVVTAQSMGAAYSGTGQTDGNGQAWIPLDINVSFFPQVTATLNFLDCDSMTVAITSIEVYEDSTAAGTTGWVMPFVADYCDGNPGGGGGGGGGGGTGGGGGGTGGGDPCNVEFTLTQATTPIGGPEPWHVWAIVPEPDPFTSYFWDFGDGNSSDEANPVHVYAEAGDYLLCLTSVNDSLGCTSVHCDTISLDENGFRQEIMLGVIFDAGQLNGVEDEASVGLTLFPNPASSMLNIRMHGLVRVEIRDAAGRFIRASSAMEGHMALDVSNLPGGTYFIQCEGVDGAVLRRVVLY